MSSFLVYCTKLWLIFNMAVSVCYAYKYTNQTAVFIMTTEVSKPNCVLRNSHIPRRGFTGPATVYHQWTPGASRFRRSQKLGMMHSRIVLYYWDSLCMWYRNLKIGNQLNDKELLMCMVHNLVITANVSGINTITKGWCVFDLPVM